MSIGGYLPTSKTSMLSADTNGGLNLVGLNPATEGFPYAPTTTATRVRPTVKLQ